uniref:Clathrin/coatomer adaptor adaptin-like N-terminal domain-containing protein n=1 Tax=Panagrolaimus davidi TaxID=227884 RepID=A0A914PQT9_9BILA
MLSFMHYLFSAKLPQITIDTQENLKIQTPEEKYMIKSLAKNAEDNCFNGNIDAQLAAISSIRDIIHSKAAVVTIYKAVSICTNLCQNGSPKVIQAMNSLLKKHIQNSDPVIILLGLNAFFRAIKRPELITIVIDRNIVKHFVQLSKHSDKDVKMTAFIILAKIFERDYMKAALNFGIIKLLPSFLSSEETQLKKEAVNIIYKIVSNGTKDDIQDLIRANTIPNLCSIFDCNDENLFGIILSSLNGILQKSGKMSSDVWKMLRKSGSSEILKKFMEINHSLS